MSAAPYLLEEPATPTPVVVSVPHAGVLVPDEDRPLVGADERTILRDADLFVDRLWARAPSFGAALLTARLSRYVLDLNRSPHDVDEEVCLELQTPARANPRALIWRLSTEGVAVLPRPLRKAELDSRIARVHSPYHERLAALLEERRQRFGFAVLVDGHSMPSVGRLTHSDPGLRRPDVVPGDVRGRSCATSLSNLVKEHFSTLGFGVVPNEPYMGGYITRHHGRPRDDVHAIQLEVNRDLYMDEETCVYDEGRAALLAGAFEALLERLVTFKP